MTYNLKFILFDEFIPSFRLIVQDPITYDLILSKLNENVSLYKSVTLVVDLKDFPIIVLQQLHSKSKYVDPSAIPSETSFVLFITVTFVASKD